MSELIGGSDDECIKRIFGVECVIDGFKIQSTLRWWLSQLRRRFFSDVNHVDIAEACRLGSLDNDIDMVIQPFLKECVWNTDVECLRVMFDQLGWLEPCVVALL